jgi:hypothetical protein
MSVGLPKCSPNCRSFRGGRGQFWASETPEPSAQREAKSPSRHRFLNHFKGRIGRPDAVLSAT